jgi:hypothetical protein
MNVGEMMGRPSAPAANPAALRRLLQSVRKTGRGASPVQPIQAAVLAAMQTHGSTAAGPLGQAAGTAATPPDPYNDPGEHEAATRARILAGGGTAAQAHAKVSANARKYAVMRLRQLQASGLSDDQGSIADASASALASGDPMAAWRELSTRFMGAFQSGGGQGDPRLWLQQQIAQRRAAATAVAKQRLAEAKARKVDALSS